MACYTALVIVQPTLLEALLDNLASDSPSAAVGFPLAAGIFACAAVSSVSVHKFWFDAQRAGMRVTAALSTEVFRRTMALGPVDRAGYGTGQLTQLMGVDSERLTSGMVLPMLIWGSWPPLVMLVVGLSNLYRLLGWPALVAAALLGSMPFVNAGCLSVRIRNAQSRVQAARDDRIRAATEVLSNVRSLKVLGWEGPSLERVFGLRRKELRAIRTDLLWRVTSALLVVLVPAAATCVSFALYAVVLGKPMAAATVFTATAWIGTLQGPMWQIPSAIRAAATASVSFERLANFFWRTGVVTPLRLLEGDPEEPPAVQWDGTDVLWPSTAAEGSDAEEGGEDSERPAPDGCCDKGSRLSLMTARLVAAAACCCCPPGRSRTPPAAAADLMRGVPAPGGDMGEGGATSSAGAPAAAAVLRNVRLRLGPGLNIVLGATGAGKSSLLASLTGAPIVRGSPPAVRGQTAFVGQRPWLLNATVRENITFVSPFRRAWFDRVVDACALREDMAFFPKGEDTQIGERGISISGGQRARIAIARALYSEAKVVLLDDPLAALDAAVARHVLEHCVLALMARQGAVVVMGTNLLSLARHPEAVSVALLESGKGGDGASGLRVIAKSELASLRLESEAPAQLETASTLDVPRAAAAGAADAADAGDAAETASTGSRSPSVRGGLPVPSLSASAKRQPDDGKALVGMSDAMERSEHTLLSPQRPALGALAGSSATQVEAFADRMAYAADMLRSTSATEAGDAKDRGSGTAAPVSGRGQGAEEASQSGFVRLRVFWRYCAACGPAAFTVTYALALAVREVSLLGSDLFLTVWVNSAKGNATAPDPAGGGSGNAASAGAFDGGLLLGGVCTDAHDAECFAVVYSLFQSATVFMAVLMWLLGVLGSLSASRRLHDSLMTSLLLASQSFFDATPSGLVVNRAVKDMQMVDLSVATNVRTFVFNVLRLLSATILVAAGSPWVLAAMAVLALPYYALALRFRHAARDLQRLSSASNSPLLSLFGETAGGAHVMRAFGSGAKFLARHRVLAMSYTTRSMLLMAVEQWATVWLEVFGSVVVLATAVMLVVARLEGAIPVAIVGFLLTQAQSVPSRLLWVTRNFASLELALVSAERVFEFVDLPDESRSAGSSPAERTKSWCSRMCSCCGKQIEPADDGSATEALLADASVAEAAEALGVVGAGGRCSLPAWAKAGRTGTTGVDRAAPRGSGKGARLELAGVRLQYDETTAPALRGVHIDLPAGCKAAVVGRSGAGKSSLLAAILQTHAFSGDVRVAGKSLVPAGPWEARKHFAPLSQDAAVFEATVRENVMGFGQDPSALADDTCRKALREVGLSTRLPDLDEGLQSSGSLSRGEAQLLGLARCLARAWTLGCGVVLADEATSSVDRGADTRVHDVLFGLPQTVVSICHRLDHISRFDHVVVMHEGVASEQGPPAELLADPSSRLSSLMEHYRASHEREHTA